MRKPVLPWKQRLKYINMSVSSDIKEYLEGENENRKPCCIDSFQRGKVGLIFKEACPGCRSAFIGGVFTGFGSMTDPAKSFHLDMRLPAPLADKVSAMLREEGLEPGRHHLRGDKHRLYYKVSSAIGDFLTYIGASKFALEVMEREIINSVRFEENRKYNAEMANLDRAATAAAEQLLQISVLKDCGALESLSEELKETALLREQYPEMSLTELARQFSPPISKSGLNHRLKRLSEEAQKIKYR